ncbi:MAG: hypothetical protein WCO05_02345 [Candidatus Moraniibacteriota bacterium]|jgi:hypothetical protein
MKLISDIQSRLSSGGKKIAWLGIFGTVVVPSYYVKTIWGIALIALACALLFILPPEEYLCDK